MDRRGFFKTLIATPLLTPFLLASESSESALQLSVISDSPHLFLPSILSGLNEYGFLSGQTFTLINFHPEKKGLKDALALSGRKCVSTAAKADFTISFSPLHNKMAPSFTLVKSGKVWDVRSRKLSALWKEMYYHHSPSSCLTTISYNTKKSQHQPGRYASVYIQGQKVERLSLKKDAALSFTAEKGKVHVTVKNGQARVTDSSCRNEICISTPPASFAGERIICAPNRFLLEIQASSFADTVIG